MSVRKYLVAISFICLLSVISAACCFQKTWRQQSIQPLTYFIHDEIIINRPSWITSINDAHRAWNGVYKLFSDPYGGRTSVQGFNQDGVNSVFLTSGLGFDPAGTSHTGRSGCNVFETDLGFNESTVFSTSDTNVVIDLQSIATHEFGHFAILLHVRCPSGSVMLKKYNPHIHGITWRTLHFCDGLGIWVANLLPACLPATGICFPSFFALAAFDNTDDENETTANTFGNSNEELIQIWDGDPTLQSNSDAVGDFYARMADDWRNGGSLAASEVFTSARYQELDTQIISRVYANASIPLRADIDNVRTHLQGKIGQTLLNVFTSDLVKNYPSGGGGGGGTGECTTCRLK